jgi:ethanolamine utilization microcompartment shell protein EutS
MQTIKKPKRAFLIITAGNSSCEGANIIIKQAELASGMMNTKLSGSFVLNGTDNLNEVKMQKALQEIRNKAVEFITEA